LEALKRAVREYLDLRLRFFMRSGWLSAEECRELLEWLDRHPIIEELFPRLRRTLKSCMKWCADTTSYEEFIDSSRRRVEEAKTIEEVVAVLEDVNRELFERGLSGPRAEG